MYTPADHDLLRQHVSIDGDGNVVGHDNTVIITQQKGDYYTVQIGQQHFRLTTNDLRRILNVKDSQIGVIGNGTTIHGGIHLKQVTTLPRLFFALLIAAVVLLAIIALPHAVNMFGQISPVAEIAHEPSTNTLDSRAFPPETEGEVLIVIARFYYNEGLYNTNAHNEIKRAIEEAADQLDFTNMRVEVAPTELQETDRVGAEALGDLYNASIVIWGQDAGVRVSVNFYNRRQPDFATTLIPIEEIDQTLIKDPKKYSDFIVEGLPTQLTFLTFFAISQSYLAEEAYDEGLQVLEFAVTQLNQDNINKEVANSYFEAYFRLGWLYQVHFQNSTEAIVKYDRALDFNPTDPTTYYNRGTAHAALENYPQALEDFNAAIEYATTLYNPHENTQILAMAHINRGHTHHALAAYDEAIADYSEALKFDPENAAAYYSRGNSYLLIGGNEQLALADLMQAAELSTEYFEIYYDLACAHALLSHADEACAALEKAITLDNQARQLATTDDDFDKIRAESCFETLIQEK